LPHWSIPIVEALQAGQVQRAEAWGFGSLWQRGRSGEGLVELAEGPVTLPERWIEEVNGPQSEAALRRGVQRGQPYGEGSRVRRVAGRLGLQSTLWPRGRPCKLAREPGKPGAAGPTCCRRWPSSKRSDRHVETSRNTRD
jgi:hypothetical protein